MSRLVLGLDLGESSIGGALVELTDQDELIEVKWCNPRIFESPLDPKTKKTANEVRRVQRGQRKLLKRRAKHRQDVVKTLEQIGLLPSDPHLRAVVLGEVSQKGGSKYLNPYYLRAQALDEQLELFEIGRAIQHLLQRRGFRSNKKARLDELVRSTPELLSEPEVRAWLDSLEDIDESEVTQSPGTDSAKQVQESSGLEEVPDDPRKTLEAIKWLQERFDTSNHRTIGAYLADQHAQGNKVRKINRISRLWLEQELDAIWEFQRKFYPNILTEDGLIELKQFFVQRPLKPFRFKLPKRGFVPELQGIDLRSTEGRLAVKSALRYNKSCSLLGPPKPVAKQGHWVAHRYRILETLHNVRIIKDGHSRPLTLEEIQRVANHMQQERKLTWPALCGLLGYKKGEASTNFDKSGADEKHLAGNTTEIELKSILGDLWCSDLPPVNSSAEDAAKYDYTMLCQLELFHDLESTTSPTDLFKLLRKPKVNGPANTDSAANPMYPIPTMQALQLIAMPRSNKTVNYSVRGMRRLYKLMWQGVTPYQAKQQLKATEPTIDTFERLPFPKPLRNPRLYQALIELRHVINELLDTYGTFDHIRLEVLRDMTMSAKRRRAKEKSDKENEKQKGQAKELLLGFGLKDPSYKDIRRCRLWIRQKERCPYCLQAISISDLINGHAQVSHIVPQTSGDNSLANLILAHGKCNADVTDRLPTQVWSGKDFEDRLAFIKALKIAGMERRFCLTDIPSDSAEFQLSISKGIALEASRYLEQLNMPGIPWGDGAKKVWLTNGKSTSVLRRAWGLDSILNPDGKGKTRDDHRHHVIDAIVIALTTPTRYVQAEMIQNECPNVRIYKPPIETIRNSVAACVVSHAVKRGVRGSLHSETYYAKITLPDQAPFYSSRKPIRDLYDNRDKKKRTFEGTRERILANVYDIDLRDALLRRLAAGDWVTAFDNAPVTLVNARGLSFQVSTVRLKHKNTNSVRTLRGNEAALGPYVDVMNIHHAEVVVDSNGKWSHRTISTLEAAKLVRSGRSCYGTNLPPDVQYQFALHLNDTVTYEGSLWRVSTLASECIRLSALADARPSTEKKNRKRVAGKSLSNIRKLSVNAIGIVSESNGP